MTGRPLRRWASAVLVRLPLIVIAPLLALIAMGGWVVAQPIGAGPDDDYHLASIWCANGERAGLCEPAARSGERRVPQGLVRVARCFAMDPTESAACQRDPSRDPTVLKPTDRVDTTGAYPPVYVSVMNLFVGSDVTASAMAMRLVNVLLIIGVGLTAFLLLPRTLRPGLLLSWMIMTMPLGISLFTTNNPTTWSVVGVGTAWLAVWGYLAAEERRRALGLGGLATLSVVMAAGSRADAAVYAAIAVGVGAVLGFAGTRRFWRRAVLILPLWGFSAVMFLVARQSGSAVNGFSKWQSVSGNRSDGSFVPPDPSALFVDNVLKLPSLWTGVFGGDWGLGWLDVPVPPLATFLILLAAAGVGFLGLRWMSPRKAAMLACLVLVLTVVPLYVLQRSQASVGREVQPRYLLPLLLVLAGVLLVETSGRRTIRLGFAQSVLVWAALSVAQALALQSTLRRYITGTDVGGLNLDSGGEWWWSWAPSPMTVLVVTSVAYSMLVAMLLYVAHQQATYARLESGKFEGIREPRGNQPAPTAR